MIFIYTPGSHTVRAEKGGRGQTNDSIHACTAATAAIVWLPPLGVCLRYYRIITYITVIYIVYDKTLSFFHYIF